MENINLIDATSLIIIFISSSLAYFRGLAREVLAIFSWVFSAVFAFVLAPLINPVLNKIPIVNEILAESCQLSVLISFVIGFILSLVFFSLVVSLITNIIQRSSLSGIDKFLGLCFGALRGLIILILVMIGYDLFFANGNYPSVIENSQANKIIFAVKEDLKDTLPKTKPAWIMNRFDSLMKTCGEES